MSRALRITRLAVHRFGWEVADLGLDYNGFNQVYQAGSCLPHTGYVLTIATDAGIVGEYVGGTAASYAQVGMLAQYLLGRDPLEREPQRVLHDVEDGIVSRQEARKIYGVAIDDDDPALNLAATERLRADLRKERLREQK